LHVSEWFKNKAKEQYYFVPINEVLLEESCSLIYELPMPDFATRWPS
jgi:hypothetical protein